MLLNRARCLIASGSTRSVALAPGGTGRTRWRAGSADAGCRPGDGRFLNILVRSPTAPTILELGTSFGYSGIWLAGAARATGGRLITMEVHGYKSAHAQTMAERAGLAEHIDFRVGDAVAMIRELRGKVDFVLVDLWKDSTCRASRPSIRSSMRARSLPTT